MNVTLDVKDLRSVVERVRGAIGAGDKVAPVFTHVLLVARNDGLRAVARSPEGLGIESIVPATVAAPGQACIPGRLLNDYAKKMSEAEACTIQIVGPRARLVCGRGRYELPILMDDQFPEFEADGWKHQARLPANELMGLIAGVAYAQSREVTRFYLCGCFFHVHRGPDGVPRLRAVATDGHRLARQEGSCPASAEQAPGVILPRYAIGEVLRALEPLATAPVDVSWWDGQVRITAGLTTIYTELINGTFPDYERVIPKHDGPAMEADAAELRDAIGRVATLAGKKGRVELRISAGELVLHACDPQIGEATDAIPVTWAGPPVRAGYSARYLLDTLGRVTGERVRLQPGAVDNAPAIITDPSTSDALFLVMPMQ